MKTLMALGCAALMMVSSSAAFSQDALDYLHTPDKDKKQDEKPRVATAEEKEVYRLQRKLALKRKIAQLKRQIAATEARQRKVRAFFSAFGNSLDESYRDTERSNAAIDRIANDTERSFQNDQIIMNQVWDSGY